MTNKTNIKKTIVTISTINTFIMCFCFTFINRAYNEQVNLSWLIVYGVTSDIGTIVANQLFNKHKIKNMIFKYQYILVLCAKVVDLVGIILYYLTNSLELILISDMLVLVLYLLIENIMAEGISVFLSGTERAKFDRDRNTLRCIGTMVASGIAFLISTIFIKNANISKAFVLFLELTYFAVTTPLQILYLKIIREILNKK